MDEQVPKLPSLSGLEAKWARQWDLDGTYRFERRPRAEVFAIDTPPPTVSGSLHVGHVLSFTHTDIIARFRRMGGQDVFYPMGWDDNGLPTERRVQNHFGVRCDPSLAHDPEFVPPDRPDPRNPVPVSRPGFIELCERLAAEDERAFEGLFRQIGLSVDWSLSYTTIDTRSRRTAQRAFLRNLARGEAYQADAPTLWDVDFQTAVAQAEVVDREAASHWHTLAFGVPDGNPADDNPADGNPADGNPADDNPAEGGGTRRSPAVRPEIRPEIRPEVLVETTRPELLPACVALVAHPSDGRYADLVGTDVVTPLFGVAVPVYASVLADPGIGSGLVMVCTFGDSTDVTWWRELALPVRPVIGPDGRLLPQAPPGVAPEPYAQLAGLTVTQARRRVVELLGAAGATRGEPRPVRRPVPHYERGDRPLEIVTTRQWYLRNGGRDEQLRAALLDRGRELRWHPAHFWSRYENWVSRLAGDWLVSRQRFFGVPFPVWYPLDADGTPGHDRPLVPDESALPVDPSTDVPPGYRAEQRGRPGGFAADPDVMDTWATSSLTPQIAGRELDDPDLFARVFPMDLRPQAHEIIRTWLFATVVRAHLEYGRLPWSDAAISGWVLAPDRKKMSKSAGNGVVPTAPVREYGADAVRYWAANARLGVDTAFDTGQLRVGRRLGVKLLNASRFVLGLPLPAGSGPVTAQVDRAMLARLAGVVDAATDALDRYDHAEAADRIETFFWWFCDDHLELVKSRAYGTSTGTAGEGGRHTAAAGGGSGAGSGGGGSAVVAGGGSAVAALRIALDTVLRLFAPILPFVTEEIWSWWRRGSVHRAEWPSGEELRRVANRPDPRVAEAASWVLAAVRRAKSEARVSMRAPVTQLVVRANEGWATALRHAATDLTLASVATHLRVEPATGDPEVEVQLAPPAHTGPGDAGSAGAG